ncbi:hypothetical protein Cfor_06247 [Coptotermes formosanus]|uniref:Uncharacterized protein n=1 Tax=Coptotermes formosanus TaxID=36987 RepID=A0A6L2PBR4_COPFO|nr:hypothetical protein Cfor_06247 [Coptotermes formosanus]
MDCIIRTAFVSGKNEYGNRSSSHDFLGPEGRPSGCVNSARNNHQRRSVVCHSEAAPARLSKLTAGSVVKRRDSSARQCAPACCCQNASNASRVWLGSF